MFQNIRIGYQITLGFTLVLLLTIALITPITLNKIESIINSAEQRELNGLYENALAQVSQEGRMAEAMSALVANIPEVHTAFAKDNREGLNAILVSSFKVMKEQYGVRQFQFHTPPAISYSRIHKTQKFGDDLSSFRKTVVKTNTEKTPVRGVEIGVAGLGVRGMVPVFHEGEHVGSVEFGMSFGQQFFDAFKKNYNVDIGLHLVREGVFKKFASTIKDTDMLTAQDLQDGVAGETVIRYASLHDTPVTVYGRSINDFSGNPIGVLEIVMDRTEYLAALASARNIALMVGLGAIIIGLLIAAFITRGITKPLNQAASAMEDIAEGEGDLTLRLTEQGKNEISMLARSFNKFAEKVHGLVTDVARHTEEVAAASEEMSNITSITNTGVNKQRHEIDQVASAMNEMTATVQEVAKHATEASQSASNADTESENGKRVVMVTIETINSLASEVGSAGEVIKLLKSQSENIGSVLDVIKEIAEQTNLLALNAAIEAARAGEQGRGFAVVADEVRTLASRTQQSTQEIETMIDQLQSGASNAVEAMAKGNEAAQASVEQAAEAGSSLEKITAAVANISDMNTQIASAAEEQSAVAEEINRNVVNINTMAEDVTHGAEQTATSSQALAELALQLQGLVRQFKI
ncbi:MAG: methyl-accepting chemotaxis protein [Gammaproteobacteria bacterium]|nr:methyl-accepting chemotaxis protein [Gammaproteobacteria bacterium]